MEMENEKHKCDIRSLTKLRNGYDNWWCYTHFAPARGAGNTRLEKCDKADLPPLSEKEKIFIDLDKWSGVGIWGALEPVFDSKKEIHDKGIHVHLRKNQDGDKEVDFTFKEVYLKVPSQNIFEAEKWIKINEDIACAYTASNVFNKKLKIIECSHCARQHVDMDWFAVHPHKKHFCTYCGRDFFDREEGISNPVWFIQQTFKDYLKDRQIVNVQRELVIKQQDYKGGIQIWASNPAIIWTAKRPEEAGIHIHCFNSKQEPPIIDDTFGLVEIDGIRLDDQMLRYYMVQKSLGYLEKYLTSLTCPNCNKAHFDIEDKALNPHKIHECEHCGHTFEDNTKFKGVVSNPIKNVFSQLEINRNLLNL